MIAAKRLEVIEVIEVVIEIEDMHVGMGKGVASIKEAMTEKAGMPEAAKETRVPRLSDSIDRNKMNALTLVVNVKAMKTMKAMSESTCGEQSQAHCQAENQRRNKFANLGHCVVLTFYQYSPAI